MARTARDGEECIAQIARVEKSFSRRPKGECLPDLWPGLSQKWIQRGGKSLLRG
jgi:hypothetical protein